MNLITLKELTLEAKLELSKNKCYPEYIRQKIEVYDISICDNLQKEISKIYSELQEKGNAEDYFSNFYSNIVQFADTYFLDLEKPLCTLLTTRLCDKIFHFFKRPAYFPVEAPTPITQKEMGGLQYLSGYVVRKFLKKVKNNDNYESPESQSIISILSNAIAADTSDQELIEVRNRGGLTGVTEECQQLFICAELKFRVETSQPNIRKVDTKKIVSELLQDPDVISFYNCIVDSSDRNIVHDEVKTNLLENMLNLYVRVRAFSLTKDIVTRHKQAIKQTKAKGLRKSIKKSTNKPSESV